MTVTAVIPVKALAEAKSRLGKVLDTGRRQALVLDMLQHVLGVVRGSGVDRVLVVTRDPAVGVVAARHGADWFPAPADTLNASLGEVFRRCWERGQTPLYLPADLPRLGRSDVEALLDAGAGESTVVLSPAWDGGGTNALFAPASSRMEPHLGVRSFARHLALGKRLGISTVVHRSPALGLDIDTPEDLLLLPDYARNPTVHAR